jgi:hypothetical protein
MTCLECCAPFEPRHGSQRFCQATCRYRHRDRAKATTPCAGGCGTLLHSGRGSLPPGERLCRPCRASPTRQAARRIGRRAVNRSYAASQRAARRAVPLGTCHGCGGSTTGLKRFCEGCAAAKQQRKNAVRRGASPLGPAISIADLGLRDRWRCHLCRRKVDRALPYQHRMAGTRDHLVPVSDGGDDSPANLRLAHRSCNSSRGARGTVQLALVG